MVDFDKLEDKLTPSGVDLATASKMDEMLAIAFGAVVDLAEDVGNDTLAKRGAATLVMRWLRDDMKMTQSAFLFDRLMFCDEPWEHTGDDEFDEWMGDE